MAQNQNLWCSMHAAGKSGFRSLLSLGHSSGNTDRVYMKGLGGRGEVEVAVSGVLDPKADGINTNGCCSIKLG